MDTSPSLTANTTTRTDLLPSERIARGMLPRVLTAFDLVAIFVCIVLFLSNSAILAGGAGPAAYVYWALGFLTFLIPGAIITGQLGLMFPGEGSLYLWTHKAFGPFMGFFAGFCAWWPGMLGLVATGDGVVSLAQQLNASWLTAPWQQGVVIVLVIALSCVLSLLRLRVTQRVINIGFVAYGVAILLVGLAGLLTVLHHQAAPVNYALHNWAPTPATWTFYGTVILALLGIEVPLNMGVEIRETRAITRYLFWGSLVVIAAYLLGTFGVMTAVQPISAQGSPAAIAEAVRAGFGPLGSLLGVLVTLIFIGFFLFATTVYNYSFARLIFVSGLDRRLPAFMSQLNASHVPAVAVLVQSGIATVLTLLLFVILPYTLPLGMSAADLSTVVYILPQAAIVVIWCLSMVLLFVNVLIIRRKYRANFEAVRLAPDWLFTLCSAAGVLASAAGIIVTFTAPWTNLVTPHAWLLWIGGLVTGSLLLGVALFLLSQRREMQVQASGSVVEDANLEEQA
jgi:amino acid transporter